MEIKSNPLAGQTEPAGGKEKKDNTLLKQQINNFLINYFNFIILAIALIIFIAGLFLFIYPQYQKIKTSEAMEKDKLQTEYQTKSAYLNKISNLKKSYQQISEANRKKIEKMVPTDNKITDLIPEIESIVLRNGAVLNSIKIESDDAGQTGVKAKVESSGKPESLAGIFAGQLPPEARLVRLEINLSSVNYQVLKNIVKAFENNLRLLDIAKINYAVLENKVVLIIYSYYLVG